MRWMVLLFLCFATEGCATLVNGERQMVFFKDGPVDGTTKVISPDGTFELQSGTGFYMLTRSRSDIPIRIVCPDGKASSGLLATRWSWLPGVFGNLLNGGWGWLIDPFTNQAYDIEDFSVASHCSVEPGSNVAH